MHDGFKKEETVSKSTKWILQSARNNRSVNITNVINEKPQRNGKNIDKVDVSYERCCNRTEKADVEYKYGSDDGYSG